MLTDGESDLSDSRRNHKAGARGPPRLGPPLSMVPCNYSNSVEAASVEREALIPGCVLMEVMVLNTECGGDETLWPES